jgi:hypothetical protein
MTGPAERYKRPLGGSEASPRVTGRGCHAALDGEGKPARAEEVSHLTDRRDPPQHLHPRASWPRCDARTRGKPGRRKPGRCQAAGLGIGGRCHFHGGMALGAPHRKGTAKPPAARQLVLLTTWFELVGDIGRKVPRTPWCVMALPMDLFQVLPEAAHDAVHDAAYVQAELEEQGVLRKVATRWPQPLGYRVALKLAQRGRIAFAIISGRADARRLSRARAGRFEAGAWYISAQDVLLALERASDPLTCHQGRVPANTVTRSSGCLR